MTPCLHLSVPINLKLYLNNGQQQTIDISNYCNTFREDKEAHATVV